MDRALQGARGVVLDLDGTLVDTTYVHTLCWWQAFRQYEEHPRWRLCTARSAWVRIASSDTCWDLSGTPAPIPTSPSPTTRSSRVARPGHATARGLQLIRWCHPVDLLVVLATSSGGRHRRPCSAVSATLTSTWWSPRVMSRSRNREVRSSRRRWRAVTWTPRHTLFVGDSVWDLQACRAVDGVGIGLECGGTSAAELRDAGAAHVFPDPAALLQALMDW